MNNSEIYKNIISSLSDFHCIINQEGKIIEYHISESCVIFKDIELDNKNLLDLPLLVKTKNEIKKSIDNVISKMQENSFLFSQQIKNENYYFEVKFIPNKKDIIVIFKDITEFKSNEERLYKSESTYRNLIELLPNGIIIRDKTGVLFANKKALEIIGCTNYEDIFDIDIETIFLPEYIDIIRERNMLLKQGIEQPFIEAKIKKLDDNKIVEVETLTTLVNYLGKEAYQVVFRDISDEKNLLTTKLRADIAEENFKKLRQEVISRQQVEQELSKILEEKSILLKEVHHRVKNNLQIISSIINLEKKNINDNLSNNILNKIQNRINSIYLVHEIIYKTDNFSRIDFKKYIFLIADNMIRNNGYSDANIHYELENIFLPLDISVPCGMIMNEALYNFFSNLDLFEDKQQISIKLYMKELHVVIEILYPDLRKNTKDVNKIHSHFSMQLLDALVDQIGGEYTFDRSSSKRISFILHFKI